MTHALHHGDCLDVLAREVIIAMTAQDYPDTSREDLLAEWETVPEEDRTIVRERLRPALDAVLKLIQEGAE